MSVESNWSLYSMFLEEGNPNKWILPSKEKLPITTSQILEIQ